MLRLSFPNSRRRWCLHLQQRLCVRCLLSSRLPNFRRRRRCQDHIWELGIQSQRHILLYHPLHHPLLPIHHPQRNISLRQQPHERIFVLVIVYRLAMDRKLDFLDGAAFFWFLRGRGLLHGGGFPALDWRFRIRLGGRRCWALVLALGGDRGKRWCCGR